MRLQSKSATYYVFKNFIYLLPLVVLPSLMLAFFQSEKGPVVLFINMANIIKSGGQISFAHFYTDLYSFFSLVNIKSDAVLGINAIWFWLFTYVVLIIGLCMAFTFVERHIKLGTHRYGNFFKNLNESFLFLFPYLFLMFVLYQVWTLLLCGAIVLISIIAQGWAFFAFSLFITLIFYTAYFVFFSLLILTPPSMYFDGYRFGFAASYSAQLTGAHFFDSVIRILATVLISQALLFLCRLLPQQFWLPDMYDNVVLILARFLFYLWWLMFLPSFSVCKYAEYTETKRADLKIKIFD